MLRPSIAHILALVFLIAIKESRAQISYKPLSLADRMEFYLPWKGPGAAMFNPASLSELGTVQLDIAGRSPMSILPNHPFLQAAVRLPLGLAAGIAGQWNTSKIDNSNAVFMEDVYVPMLAAGWPIDPEAPFQGAIGMAFPINHFNAFGAVKSTNTSMNISALMINRIPGPFGEARIGLVLQGLLQPEVTLPDGRGAYRVPREIDAAFTWTLADGVFEVHAESYRILEDVREGLSYRNGLVLHFRFSTFGLEYNPTDMVGLKLENTVFRYRTLGVIFRFASMARWRQRLEFNFTHDALSAVDEGRGFMWSAALSAGY